MRDKMRKAKYGTNDGHKLNLTQALDIQANDYLSKCGHFDYDPASVDGRIYQLQASMAGKRANALRIQMDIDLKQYNDFLDSQGVPEFYFTWNDETQSYIEF